MPRWMAGRMEYVQGVRVRLKAQVVGPEMGMGSSGLEEGVVVLYSVGGEGRTSRVEFRAKKG